MEFIRRYIHVTKLVKPVLTQEASDYIAEEYSRLQSHDQVNLKCKIRVHLKCQILGAFHVIVTLELLGLI